jgi:hypothetical protein
MSERADKLHHDNAPAHSTSLGQAVFGKALHHQGLSAPLQPRFGSPRLLVFFFKTKIAVASEEICECDSHTLHKLSQWRLTADWLAPRESDCSRMRSTVSSDWLPSYIKATRPFLEIFKMAGYFPDSPLKFIIECYMFRPHMPSSDNKMHNLKQKCVAYVWKFLIVSVHTYSYIKLCILLRDGESFSSFLCTLTHILNCVFYCVMVILRPKRMAFGEELYGRLLCRKAVQSVILRSS